MTYLALLLALALLGALLAAFFYRADARAAWTRATEAAATAGAAEERAVDVSQAAQAELAQLENVIAYYRKEIADLRRDADACANPDAVRHRLARLLGSPTAPDAGPPAPGVPDRAAPG